MLFLYADENVWTDSQRTACYLESAQIAHRLTSRAEFLDSNPLYSVSTATCVQVRNGERVLTDGPATETPEQLCGYFLIEAKNLDAAIEIAGLLPSSREGTIEIRPVAELSSPTRDCLQQRLGLPRLLM